MSTDTENFFLFWVDFAELLSCLCFTKRGWPFAFAPKTPTTDYLKFCVGMPVVQTDGRAVGVRSRDYQIFSDGQFTIFSYPWCSAINNSKSGKGKKICMGEDFWHFYWTLLNGWLWKFAWHLFYLGKLLFEYNRWNHGILKPKCDVPRENLPHEMPFTVLYVTAPNVWHEALILTFKSNSFAKSLSSIPNKDIKD